MFVSLDSDVIIDQIRFRNFKVLRNATLPLGRFTLIVGPNGSGKSSVFQALEALRQSPDLNYRTGLSLAARSDPNAQIEITVKWGGKRSGATTTYRLGSRSVDKRHEPHASEFEQFLSSMRFYSLDPREIAEPVKLAPEMELARSGQRVAGVLDRLRDKHPERFEAMNQELHRWLPEYDRVLFDTPTEGSRSFLLRTSNGAEPIAATELSQGTQLALVFLTLAHLPDPPSLIGIEEPDHGIHPRLLRQVRDALYRLSYPESAGENRPGVQVIATTHSPYFLDLFRDHPEEVVVAQKQGNEATFERLNDRKDIGEILANAPLGEVWYSGILGGVPTNS